MVWPVYYPRADHNSVHVSPYYKRNDGQIWMRTSTSVKNTSDPKQVKSFLGSPEEYVNSYKRIYDYVREYMTCDLQCLDVIKNQELIRDVLDQHPGKMSIINLCSLSTILMKKVFMHYEKCFGSNSVSSKQKNQAYQVLQRTLFCRARSWLKCDENTTCAEVIKPFDDAIKEA